MLRTENNGERFVGRDAANLRNLGPWPEMSADGEDTTRTELYQQTQTSYANCVTRSVVPELD